MGLGAPFLAYFARSGGQRSARLGRDARVGTGALARPCGPGVSGRSALGRQPREGHEFIRAVNLSTGRSPPRNLLSAAITTTQVWMMLMWGQPPSPVQRPSRIGPQRPGRQVREGHEFIRAVNSPKTRPALQRSVSRPHPTTSCHSDPGEAR